MVVAVAMLSAGCSTAASTVSSGPSTTEAPLPAGVHPSKIAQVVCEKEAQHDLASALGETATVSTPTWVDHLYVCRYIYPSGSMTLSIKELSSWNQTLAYFNGFGRPDGEEAGPAGTGSGCLPDH